MIDRSRIAALVRSALGEMAPERLDGAGGVLLAPDRGVNLAPADAPALRAQLEATPARIAVGRAGTRYRTNTLLRFRADHAAAKDAVMSEVDRGLIAKLGLVEVASRAESKQHFLQRPDAGRALSDEGRATVDAKIEKGAQVVLVYGDGLSAAALNAHLETLHGALVPALRARGLRVATPIFVRYSRLKVLDEIARITAPDACVFACGERPGLGFADSMSAYYMYCAPGRTPTDADREVISNINPRGLAPTKAAEQLAEACARVIRERKSGVVIG